jgi:hypothetical protein
MTVGGWKKCNEKVLYVGVDGLIHGGIGIIKQVNVHKSVDLYEKVYR